jgi:2-aminoethylphosphonate-pyruvate transaminase
VRRLLETAVILAAGMGRRLRASGEIGGPVENLPKGLVCLGGETLIERSLRALRSRGLRRIVIVAGYRADAYRELARRSTDLEVVENARYAATESMASLACALEVVDEDFLLLESDLFYEPRALDAVLGHGAPDVVLASDATGATDEVWIEAENGRVRALSKQRDQLRAVSGEFVGVLRISRPLAELMGEAWREFQERHGHGRMAYETDALVAAARKRPVHLCLVPDLLWGELDDGRHWRRLRDEVWPAFERRQSGEG